MDTSVDGLSTAQAKERIDAYGFNELDEGEKRSLLSKFIDQFKDLMIIILLVAASFLSYRRDAWFDNACIILAVVVLNAAFGVYQEGQAEAAIEALKNMSSPLARVRRDGNIVEIDSRELVPGTLFCLKQVMLFRPICVCLKLPHSRLKRLPLQVSLFQLKRILLKRLQQMQVLVTV
ncbi:MAG: cation-transporting P-type ATPase [Streptococcus sp.]